MRSGKICPGNKGRLFISQNETLFAFFYSDDFPYAFKDLEIQKMILFYFIRKLPTLLL